MEVQTLYQKAIIFAATKHLEKEQKVPGTALPYVVHLSNVAMEIIIAASNSENFNLGFAVQVALLHDVIEDTSTTFEELENKFGTDIAQAVLALTKNKKMAKVHQMQDSLTRIKSLQTEVWAVKLADRIANMQHPPQHWDKLKRIEYQNEANTILKELNGGCIFLARRLEKKILDYEKFIIN